MGSGVELWTDVIRSPIRLPIGAYLVTLFSRVQRWCAMAQVVCDDGSSLLVEQIQPPGKKAMRAADYINGLRGRRLMWR